MDDIIRVQLIGVNYPKPIMHMKNFDHTLTLAAYSKKGMFIDRRLMHSWKSCEITCINHNKPQKSLKRAQAVIQRLDPNGVQLWTFQGF